MRDIIFFDVSKSTILDDARLHDGEHFDFVKLHLAKLFRKTKVDL